MILKEESKCPFQANHKGQPTKEQNLWKKKKSESYSGFNSSVTNCLLATYILREIKVGESRVSKSFLPFNTFGGFEF